ncbi:hypothetical protein [Lishizhenia sp.]|uniref:hypothetical protein n=1 Tax=Lishizhenia sp. TaxID=2497594 RepID=UPI00299F2159|nr:hypothetical protein [Lishizhenia sp.]MDX1445893.1 hypothetical protein [Lishizhenia sp.]
MVKYGLDKLIGGQFNIVEGNLLHKELKDFSKDLLLWATLQSSELFNYVTGGVEIIGGLFILNTYTRKLGLLVCTTSLLFVVLLNFSFDINVKILSLYLLAQSIYAWGAYYKNLQNLLLPRTEIIVLDKESSPHQLNKWVISFFLLFLISEGVIQHLSSTKDRPEWAKSYEVIGENNYFIHIHSDAFIIEEKDGVFESNAFQVLNATPTKLRFKTTDVVQLILSDSTSIYWVKNQDTLEIEVIDFSHTPYLQDDFHWTTEGSLGVK